MFQFQTVVWFNEFHSSFLVETHVHSRISQRFAIEIPDLFIDICPNFLDLKCCIHFVNSFLKFMCVYVWRNVFLTLFTIQPNLYLEMFTLQYCSYISAANFVSGFWHAIFLDVFNSKYRVYLAVLIYILINSTSVLSFSDVASFLDAK